MYGYAEKEALGMKIVEVVPKGQEADALDFINQVVSGIVLPSFEAQRISKDGKVLDVLVTATCLKDDRGRIDSVATTERDITLLKNELREKANEVRKLRGFLPICSYCKKIRDDEGYWHQIETYIRDHSEAEFSHGICPKCMKELYPEFDEDDEIK